jgi:hypothetical protein
MGLPAVTAGGWSVPEVVDHAWSVQRFERELSTPDPRWIEGGEPTRCRPARTRRAGGNRRPALRNRLGGPEGAAEPVAGWLRKVAMVTGASRGQGRSHAVAQAREGVPLPHWDRGSTARTRGAKIAGIRHGASPSSANLHQLIPGQPDQTAADAIASFGAELVVQFALHNVDRCGLADLEMFVRGVV